MIAATTPWVTSPTARERSAGTKIRLVFACTAPLPFGDDRTLGASLHRAADRGGPLGADGAGPAGRGVHGVRALAGLGVGSAHRGPAPGIGRRRRRRRGPRDARRRGRRLVARPARRRTRPLDGDPVRSAASLAPCCRTCPTVGWRDSRMVPGAIAAGFSTDDDYVVYVAREGRLGGGSLPPPIPPASASSGPRARGASPPTGRCSASDTPSTATSPTWRSACSTLARARPVGDLRRPRPRPRPRRLVTRRGRSAAHRDPRGGRDRAPVVLGPRRA